MASKPEVFPVNAALTGPGTSEPGLHGLDSSSGLLLNLYNAIVVAACIAQTRQNTES